MGAVKWNSLTAFLRGGSQLAKVVLLGRLLTPHDFGLFAMTLVAVEIGQTVVQQGFSAAIIQRKDPNREELSSLYWLNILVGVSVYLLSLAAAPLLSMALGDPALIPLIQVTSLVFIITSIGTQVQARLQKLLRFQALFWVSLASDVCGLAVACFAAVTGQGAWALAWGMLATSGMETGLVLLLGLFWGLLPGMRLHVSEVSEYISFSSFRVGALLMNRINTKLDQLLVGTLLTPTLLGLYNMALRVSVMPIQQINPIITRVAFPVMALIQDDVPRIRRAYFRMVSLLLFINGPVMLGLLAVAPIMVPLVLGAQWQPIVPLVRILAVYGLMRSVGGAGGVLIVALGKPNWGLYWNLVLTVLRAMVIPVVLLTSESLIFLVVILTLLSVIFTLIQYYVMLGKLIQASLGPYLRIMLAPLSLSTIMALAVIGVQRLEFSPDRDTRFSHKRNDRGGGLPGPFLLVAAGQLGRGTGHAEAGGTQRLRGNRWGRPGCPGP